MGQWGTPPASSSLSAGDIESWREKTLGLTIALCLQQTFLWGWGGQQPS